MTTTHEGELALQNLDNLVQQARRGAFNGPDGKPSADKLRNQALRFYRGAQFAPPTASEPAQLPDRAEAATAQEIASSTTQAPRRAGRREGA